MQHAGIFFCRMNNFCFLAFLSSYCSGIFLANLSRINPMFFYIPGCVALLGAGAYLRNNIVFRLLIFITFFLAGAAAFQVSRMQPVNSIVNFVPRTGKLNCILSGTILSLPEATDKKTVFVFKVSRIYDGVFRYEASEDVQVTFPGKERFSLGEELVISGRLSLPSQRAFGRGRKPVFSADGIHFIKLNRERGFSLRRLIVNSRQKLGQAICSCLSPVASGINKAMFLGDKRDIPPNVFLAMSQSGTAHLLVISGFHVGVIAFFCMLIFKIARLPFLARTIAVILVLIGYCFITGAAIPAIRATIMAIFILIGLIVKRSPQQGRALLLAAFFILLMDPQAVFSASFQLSFFSAASIIWLCPLLKLFFSPLRIRSQIFKPMLDGFCVSLSAWVGTFWIIAYYFRIISPVAPVANIFLVPLAGIITILGLLVALLNPLVPGFTAYLVSANEFLVFSFLKLNNIFIKIPLAYFYL